MKLESVVFIAFNICAWFWIIHIFSVMLTGLDMQGQGQGQGPSLQGPGQGQGLDLQGQGQGLKFGP